MLPRRGRATTFVVALAAAIGVYRATQSAVLQFVVFLTVVEGSTRLIAPRLRTVDPPLNAPRGRRVPWRVWGPVLLVTLVVGTALSFVREPLDEAIGPVASRLLVGLPAVELLVALIRRDLRLPHDRPWKASRPVPEAVVVATGVALVVVIASVSEEETLTVTALSGLGGGAFAFVGWFLLARLD